LTDKAIGLAAVLHLDLRFELWRGPEPDEEAKWELADERALVSDCRRLLESADRLFNTCGAVSATFGNDYDPVSLQLVDLELAPSESSMSVRRLHYGSPFDLQIVLGALTVPGLGVLLWGAKRLWGIDLEFRAYREQRRIEYLAAKEVADELMDRITPAHGLDKALTRPHPTDERASRRTWKASKGTISED